MPAEQRDSFVFKQFRLHHHQSSMKVGTDAVLLGAWAPTPEQERVLDVGTGCGILALMLAQRGASHVDAIDPDQPSVEEARLNFANSPWKEKLHVHHIKLQDYRGIPGGYSLMICNPPYFRQHLTSEARRRATARHDFLLPPEDLALHAVRLGSDNSRICLIYKTRFFNDLLYAMAQGGWFLHRRQDVVGCPGGQITLTLSEWRRQPADVITMPVLKIRDDDGSWHPDYRNLTSAFYPHF